MAESDEQPISLGELMGRLGLGEQPTTWDSDMSCGLCDEQILTLPTLGFPGQKEDDMFVMTMTLGRMQDFIAAWCTHMVEKHTPGFTDEAKKQVGKRLGKIIGQSSLGN